LQAAVERLERGKTFEPQQMSAFAAPLLRRDSLRRLAQPKLTLRSEARERRLDKVSRIFQVATEESLDDDSVTAAKQPASN
jgi:hypothetical protein